eukprot:s369_g8.t1
MPRCFCKLLSHLRASGSSAPRVALLSTLAPPSLLAMSAYGHLLGQKVLYSAPNSSEVVSKTVQSVRRRAIFVANLPPDVTEAQLHADFGHAGPVANVRYKTNQATATVRYQDAAAAAWAVSAWHQTLYATRTLVVEYSRRG